MLEQGDRTANSSMSSQVSMVTWNFVKALTSFGQITSMPEQIIERKDGNHVQQDLRAKQLDQDLVELVAEK